MSPLIAGIAGTAKNTGKTTTMSALMEEIKKDPGITLALTSIGYDGEGFDNVTGLPKPRIQVWPGVIVAIAESCNRICSARLAPIKSTDISTPLGKVVINRVVGAGKVVLAGANNRRELRAVLNLLCELASLILVDGALSRLAPMVEADCLILATGAARYADIPRLAREAGCIADILSMPALEERGKAETVGSVFTEAGFKAFIDKYNHADTILIQGVMSGQYLKELSGYGEQKGKRLIFSDPVKVLLAGEAEEVWKALQALKGRYVEIGVVKQCRLLAMTVNPYYPKYRYNKADYQPAYVDGAELLETVSGTVKAPCFDVFRQGGRQIFKLIMDYREAKIGR